MRGETRNRLRILCSATGNLARSSSSPPAKSLMSLTEAVMDALAARAANGVASAARASRRSAKPVSPSARPQG